MSEAARGEGDDYGCRALSKITRLHRYSRTRTLVFLEEKYPKYGNLVPRDLATREIFHICLDGYGVDGKMQVYFDSHA